MHVNTISLSEVFRCIIHNNKKFHQHPKQFNIMKNYKYEEFHQHPKQFNIMKNYKYEEDKEITNFHSNYHVHSLSPHQC